MLDVFIIGAGIVGSWIALQAARAGLVTAICDQNTQSGDGISGRNSGVLHAGLYYQPDSYKARFCRRGYTMALDFFQQRQVPYEICGKLVTSGSPPQGLTDAEQAVWRDRAVERVHNLMHNALACGAEGLELCAEPGRKYQSVKGHLALLSNQTGVVDVPRYLKAVQVAAEEAGAIFLPGRRLIDINPSGTEVILESRTGRETIQATTIINAAGLQSDEIAHLCGLNQYTIKPNRGEYYRLSRRLPVQTLVYPLPPDPGSTALGVHYTFQLNGEAYAGPNSIWAEHKADYRISADPREFFESLQHITDFYTTADLHPGYSGLRPRLFHQDQPVKDFVIETRTHAAGCSMHLLGIESPGLTSAPALAEYVVNQIR
ncbi:MAG: FAD-dependent oxidoreductase [Leptospiraceae bacterium]|nr:FAD-dependent oxidoreductase [Leptospiraceae bacterium]